MEGLRHVVLAGWRTGWPPQRCWYSYHIKEAQAFLRCTRNLESLVAVDCGADAAHLDDYRSDSSDKLKELPWDVEFPRLKKLSINGDDIGPEEVKAIIRTTTVFEDLELFQDIVHWGRPVLDLERHLGTVKGTLKRLCYSAFPLKARLKEKDLYAMTSLDAGNDDESFDDTFDPIWHELIGFEAGVSLEDFSVLETLELEQFLLYGPVDEELDDVENDTTYKAVTTDEFLSKFPPSLVRFRMGCIFYWPIVVRDMLAMAQQHRSRFPGLESVTLEVREVPPREDFDSLVDAFREAGIALSICTVVWEPFSRGLLPARPGFPVHLPEPVSYL